MIMKHWFQGESFMTRLIALTLTLVLGALTQSQVSAQEKPRIIVGPNILVSRDGDVAHCETMIAANPRNPKNLIGGSIVLNRPDGSSVDKPYVSSDGGATWSDITLPEEMAAGSGDPQVGFGITGTAYFVGLSFTGMNFYRSEDGGKTWSKALDLGRHNDHEMLATDHTYGPYAGRVYLAAETDVPGSKEMETLKMERRVVLFRSSDDGRSFLGPIEVARGNNTGLAAENLLVLSDGTLFIPMLEYPNYAIDKNAATWKVAFSLSSDGGVTFSGRQRIGEIHFGGVSVMRKHQTSGRVDQIGGPVFAVGREGRFRDRIYAAWDELEGDRFRLMLTWSSDRGKTWTKPKPIDPDAPEYASQFQPMIAVNSEGILGVMWYDNDGFPKRDQFAVSFSTSLDGGETLLPKRPISSEPSNPYGSGNLRPGPFVTSERGILTADFVSGVSRWVNGGDYIGMTSDGDGLFHPFWADARSGTYLLYTAAIRVHTGPEVSDGIATGAQRAVVPAVEKQPASLTDKLTLVFDPIRYDQQTREVVVPVRLKNISHETLYPPFRVEVKELAHPYTVKAHEEINPPVILNASNGNNGVGAVFDYSSALGDLKALDPDAVTNAISWRLEAASPVKTNFHLGVSITGFTQPNLTAALKAEPK
jgi:hypothetical protein